MVLNGFDPFPHDPKPSKPSKPSSTWPQPQPFVIYIKRALFAPRVAQRGVLMFHQASFMAAL